MVQKMRTTRELIQLSTIYLAKYKCQTPRLDAEILLAHVLSTDRLHLYMNLDYPLEEHELEQYRNLVGRRGQRVPVAYLTGSKEFYGKSFLVTEDVLIPRPETELLVEQVIRKAGNMDAPRILEIGTGSGAIAVNLALALPRAFVIGTDLSPAALELAVANAQRLEAGENLTFIQSDLFSAVPEEKYHIICSNPPYISSGHLDKLEDELGFEPEMALNGGPDGLLYYRKLIAASPDYLRPGGYLVFEIGSEQAHPIIALGKERGFSHEQLIQDYAGYDRVVTMQWA